MNVIVLFIMLPIVMGGLFASSRFIARHLFKKSGRNLENISAVCGLLIAVVTLFFISLILPDGWGEREDSLLYGLCYVYCGLMLLLSWGTFRWGIENR